MRGKPDPLPPLLLQLAASSSLLPQPLRTSSGGSMGGLAATHSSDAVVYIGVSHAVPVDREKCLLGQQDYFAS